MPSLFIVLEKELANFDSYVNGHALYEGIRDLDPLADQFGVKKLMSFFGQVPKVIPPEPEEPGEEDNEMEQEDQAAEDSKDTEAVDQSDSEEADTSEPDEALANKPKPPVEKWFLISDGLETVQTYLNYLRRSAYAIPNAALIKKELLEWQRVLYLAGQELRLWHLGIED